MNQNPNNFNQEGKRLQLLKKLPIDKIINAGDKKNNSRLNDWSSRSYDVVISGAGPAGLYLAARLSQLKIKTLLLERSLLLDTRKTFALPDTIVHKYQLEEAVHLKHEDTYFRDYFGLNYSSEIDYCIMDQTKLLYLLARNIDFKYCRIIENCETTAFQRLTPDKLKVKTITNNYLLTDYKTALKKYPRALTFLKVDHFFYQKHNPAVCINRASALDERSKLGTNFSFEAPLLIDAGGYQSNICKSFHRQKEMTVWKCLVYEFENLARQPKEIIWDLALPTETSANFWVDVSGKRSAGVGIMVLTRTSKDAPSAHPTKELMVEYMNKWLNIQKISGRLVRERYGYIPMTDFRRPAAFNNIMFIGAAATRQIPDTGFGVFPCFEEAEMMSKVIRQALKQKKFTRKYLRRYDIAWLKACEVKMIFNKALQNFHLAYLRDEYFHQFASCCSQLEPGMIKRRMTNALTYKDIFKVGKMFLKESYLLSKNKLNLKYYNEFLDDFADFFYCFISTLLHVYNPHGNRIFRKEPRYVNLFFYPFVSLFHIFTRKIPVFFFRQCARLLFSPIVHAFLQTFFKSEDNA